MFTCCCIDTDSGMIIQEFTIGRAEDYQETTVGGTWYGTYTPKIALRKRFVCQELRLDIYFPV